MEDRLCFVQFMHPGGEHETKGDTIAWNTGAHKRKFLKNDGRYLHDGKLSEGEIGFWGEWEPESQVVDHIVNPVPEHPHFIYNPYYVMPVTDEGQQNTDPFVFGDRPLYSCCRQHTRKGGPSQLQRLQVGSVLLFGSCLNKSKFVLDTVFVVDHYDDFNLNDLEKLRDHVSNTFVDATLSRLPSNNQRFDRSTVTFRLYSGATFEQQRHGMYSFFPCAPYEESPFGFARPQIRLPGIITDNLFMGKKLNPQDNIDVVVSLWNAVREQALDQGVYIGVSTQSPPEYLQDGSVRRNEKQGQGRAPVRRSAC